MTIKENWLRNLKIFRLNYNQWSPHIVKFHMERKRGMTLSLSLSDITFCYFLIKERALMNISTVRQSRTSHAEWIIITLLKVTLNFEITNATIFLIVNHTTLLSFLVKYNCSLTYNNILRCGFIKWAYGLMATFSKTSSG